MMVKMRKMLAPVRPGYNCYEGTNKKKFLVIHQTGNERIGADANMHAVLQAGGYGASWHWQSDDKEAIQSFEHRVQCWHASDGRGDGNLNSIAIEICINRDGDYVKAVQNGAELAAWILKEENIPLANMKQHYDFARDKKNCPAQIRGGKAGIDWQKFVQMVQTELDKLNRKTAVASAKSYRVVTTVDGYTSSTDAKDKKNAKAKVQPGTYSVFNEHLGMVNVTTKAGVPGNWINPADNKVLAKKGIQLSGEAHVQSKGWIPMQNNVLGTTGEGLRLEAFSVTARDGDKLLPIKGMIHLQSLGDVEVNTNLFGTAGEKRRLEAVKLDIHSDVEYRVHMQYEGWSSWTKNNEWAGSKGKERRIEAIEFRIK